MHPALAVTGAVVPLAVGMVLLVRRRALIGGLLVVHALCFAAVLSGADTQTGRAGMVADQLLGGSWVLLFVWLVLVAYLVPDGQLPSRFWRWWVAVCLVAVVAFLVGAAGDVKGFRAAHDGADPPLRWLPEWVSVVLGGAGLVGVVLLMVGCVFAVRARLRAAAGIERRQLLWLVWGATSIPVALVLAWAGHFVLGDDPVVTDAALLLAGSALPVTIGVAVLRHGLFDIELVLSRTLVYGVLAAAVMGVYASLLLAADRLVGNRFLGGLLAVTIVALTIHPLHRALDARIERWVYGYRSDPVSALRRLGSETDAADPLQLLAAITASVTEALRAQRAWIDTAGADRSGDERVLRAPLVHRGDRIGDLVVLPPPGRVFSGPDRALLADLARQAAVTVRASQLATELQESRSRIVTAREAERKRIRQDLHDGLGPSLAAILLKLRAVQSLHDEAERAAVLAEVMEEAKEAIVDVRRVIENLRPPAVDEVGLLGAIRQRAASAMEGQLVCDVRGPEALPALPAAVEVAAFRIASEAITNVLRHSGATRCQVEVEVRDELVLTVSDNGRGAPEPPRLGVGWASMRERADEIGGRCTIRNGDGGGLVVRAVLPLHPVVSEGAA